MRKNTRNSRQQILFINQFAVLLGIEAIVCFTPLGSIPIGPIVATLAMIPVIITGVLLGPKAGSLMGFFAGLFSFIVWTFMPPNPLISFVFTPFAEGGNFYSLLICFVPRILTGTFAGLLYKGFSKKFTNKNVKNIFRYGISAVLASLTNTVLVLLGITFLFGQAFMAANEIEYALKVLIGIAWTTFSTNGLIEAFLSFVLVIAICKPLKTYIIKEEDFA